MTANHSPNRVAKEKLVSVIDEDIKGAELIVVTQQLGLNADTTRTLRVEMRKSGVGLKVAKNKLVKHAIKGTKFAGLEKFLKGPTALAYSKDPVAAARASVDFAKKNDKFKVIGGVMGDQILEEAQVKALASLPSLNELRAKLVGLLQAPATKIAGILVAPAGQLARVMSARSKQAS
ncbi:MAG: 50S ribosomal protein L10 [Alphaproteobacteria bacterium]|nr:50S ribosomal protein L10 [Alphaproteobacteria bacterium]